KKFIEWQFYKLKEKNLLIQKPHYAPFCPNCGPVAVDKSETDISKGGGSEILEFTVIKFRMDDGSFGFVANIKIKDNEGSKQLILWDDKVKEIQCYKTGDNINIDNIDYRQKNGKKTLHVNGKSVIKKLD
ncbi:unnamed protein product, partial [marine sediment metagenome]